MQDSDVGHAAGLRVQAIADWIEDNLPAILQARTERSAEDATAPATHG